LSGPGRFESQDPLGLAPDSNVYRYAVNAPITLSDPTGLKKDEIQQILAGVSTTLEPNDPRGLTTPEDRARKMAQHVANDQMNKALNDLAIDLMKTCMKAPKLAKEGFDFMEVLKEAAKEGMERLIEKAKEEQIEIK